MGKGVPLKVVRRWVDDRGAFGLRFTLTNTSATPVEIVALGMPMPFDNIITDRTLDQTHTRASFTG